MVGPYCILLPNRDGHIFKLRIDICQKLKSLTCFFYRCSASKDYLFLRCINALIVVISLLDARQGQTVSHPANPLAAC